MEPESDSQQCAGAPESEEPSKNETEDDALLSRAEKIIDKIMATASNPNPNLFHALASILETQESRNVQEIGHSSVNNGRASQTIGKLGNLIRENDEFYEYITSKFLSDGRYSVSVHLAAARLLLSTSPTWMYPMVFEDEVLESIKRWVIDDTSRVSADECNGKLKSKRTKPTDSEMMRTYATGILATALDGTRQVAEDVLASGLPAKLMRYLRSRVLGEVNTSQKDVNHPTENKYVSGPTVRSREETRSRLRQVLDGTHSDGSRMGDIGSLDDQNVERDHDRGIGVRQVHGEECWVDGGEASVEAISLFEVGEDDVEQIDDDRWQGRDFRDGKAKYGDRFGAIRPTRDEDADESSREDSSRRRASRGLTRVRGRGRITEGTSENERMLTSPGTGARSGQVQSIRDRQQSKNADMKRATDTRRFSVKVDGDGFAMERDDNDDLFKDCKIGTKDISDLVMKAIRAAEAEARAANAPDEAIKAAGDAAAELVKTAALDALKSTNDEEAAVSAASTAASTVVDAAKATEASRCCGSINVDTESSKASEPEADEELEDLFILDNEALARVREKYCIQCLEILGEYVEVLGPVLHEKGVDVCLALLQRSSKHKESSEFFTLLPDVLKLICALAAHRKFSAVFVDRGGMQKLLAVQRVPQTFFGLSSYLFTIGSLQGIMERVCALPSEVVHQLVELALQLLECPQDQARKNAAVFFAAAFVFRAILDSFDGQEGLQKMLNLLHGAASIRSGINSGALGQSNLGSLRNDRSQSEVLTSSEKQIAYHTCIALRQYFRAHLLLLVDSLRPNKNRTVARNVARAAYKPLDISNEAMDAVFLQIQRDRKLGPAFVRARWPAVDRFLSSNGHIIMLELCQAPPVESYLHDLAQYALGVLHIVTLVPYSRKPIVNATLSNERVGMAVILDAANGAGYVDPELIHPALNVLVNLVCPPPSISNKPPVSSQGQQAVSVQTLNGPTTDGRDRNAERNFLDRSLSMSGQSELRERNGEPSSVERGSAASLGALPSGNSSLTAVPTIASGVVGDRRISLGPGAGCAGLAAQLEQGYHEAREAVRANNGIKVLLHLLRPRIFTPPAALDCLRALACRVLLGLARDGTIAHILTKLQVGKKLSELIRDSGGQASGTEQGRWQAELAQVAIELISIVTNSGRASTLAATDAAAPTLRRIERAAIAAATPITYHSRELLLLIHEHLQASGLTTTAASLLKEAQLTPLPPLASPTPLLLHQTSVQETSSIQLQWPSGRAPRGFLSDASKTMPRGQISCVKTDSSVSKKPLVFLCKVNSQVKLQPPSPHPSSVNKVATSKNPFIPAGPSENPSPSSLKPNSDLDPPLKTPIMLPMKRKLMESKDTSFASPGKRIATADLGFQSPVCQTPTTACRSSQTMDFMTVAATPSSNVRYPCGRSANLSVLVDNSEDVHYNSTPMGSSTPMGQATPSTSQLGLLADPQSGSTERVTLDSLVVQYLKHQHRQCPAPITTLPPLSLLHPHVCPEPSRNLDAPTNITARLSTREFKNKYGGSHGFRRDRQFIYSRFRPLRSCRDEAALFSCITFLGDSSRIATGSPSGELKIFDTNNGNILESHSCHQSAVVFVQSAVSGDTQLVLSSSPYDVQLWDAASLTGGPIRSFEGCKAAQFSHSGAMFAALSSESSHREVLLYDVQTYNLDLKLTDSSTSPSGPVRGHVQSLIHFSPLDTMLLWNGVLWDRRVSGPVHRFDQFTDYGGGGFHPAGNEVIINSEVWDLRKFKLLRSVPSLDQTVITFNAAGNVIYAILRRNLEDIMSAVHTRRVRHPLFAAFRTVDAINYSDIATVPVDRCVLDFATEPTDSYVGLVLMDDNEEMFSSARLYEIGRRRPTDDDSDPDDGVDSEEEEDEDDDSEADEDPTLVPDLDSDTNSDAEDMSNEEDDEESVDELDDEDDVDFNLGLELDGGPGILEIVTDGEEDDDSQVVDSFSSEDERGFAGNGFGF